MRVPKIDPFRDTQLAVACLRISLYSQAISVLQTAQTMQSYIVYRDHTIFQAAVAR